MALSAQIRRPDHLPSGRLRRPSKWNEKLKSDSGIDLNHSDACSGPTEIDFGKQMLAKELVRLESESFDSQATSIKRQYDLMLVEDGKVAVESVFAIFCKSAWVDRFKEPLLAKLFLELTEQDDEESEHTLLSQLENTCESLLGVLTLLGQPTQLQCGSVTLLSNLSRVNSLPSEHSDAVISYLVDIGKAFWPYFTPGAPDYWSSDCVCDALCDVLKAVGKLLEQQYPVNSRRTFEMVSKLVISGTVSVYVRLRLLEIKDRQSYNWCLSCDSEEYYKERYFESIKVETTPDTEPNDSITEVSSKELSQDKDRQRRPSLHRSLQVETTQMQEPKSSVPVAVSKQSPPAIIAVEEVEPSQRHQTALVETVQVSESNASATVASSKQLYPVTAAEEVAKLKRPLSADSAQTDSEVSFPVDIDEKELENQLRTSVSQNIPPELHHISELNNGIDVVCSDHLPLPAVSGDKGEVVGQSRSCDVSPQLAGTVASSPSSGGVGDGEDTALGGGGHGGFGRLRTGSNASIERCRKDSRGSDGSDGSENTVFEIPLNESECRRMGWRRRSEIANVCGCQLYINDSTLVISGIPEYIKDAKRKVFEVLSAPEDRFGVLVTIPEGILSCMQTEADTASFVDKLGHCSGADIKKMSDNQLFVSGYRECVDFVKTCLGKINCVLKFGDDPDIAEETDQTQRENTIAPLEKLFRLIELEGPVAPERRNPSNMFRRTRSTSDTDWRARSHHHLQRGNSCDAVPVSSLGQVVDQPESKTGLSRNFLLRFARCPQALQRPADLSLDRKEDWITAIVLPRPRTQLGRPVQASRPTTRQASGGFGTPTSPQTLELPTESKSILLEKPMDPPGMSDIRAS